MKKVLTIKQFTYLFLATMAEQSKIIQLDPKNKDILVCVLPATYKQNIQNIMCEQNGWAEKFSTLIDVEQYFDNHFHWEDMLSLQIEDALETLGKKYEYDFFTDTIRIDFSKGEVEVILQKFPKSAQENMDHFARLVGDFIYTRQYQEQYHDNNARSIKYMHELSEKKYREPAEFEKMVQEITQKSYGEDMTK